MTFGQKRDLPQRRKRHEEKYKDRGGENPPLRWNPVAGIGDPGYYFYQMGLPPMRVDILMGVPGMNFEQAWEHRVV
jgi:hypothetical protein